MKKTISLLSLLFISSCATYPVPRYSVSANNVLAFKKLNQKIATTPFTWTAPGSHNNFQCRAAGPIETSEKRVFENYIQGAIEDELKLAEVFNEKGVPLNITFKFIDSDSTKGTWTLRSDVSFGSAHFSHDSLTKYETGFFAENACKGAANSFIAAVQDYTSTLIPKLAAATKSGTAKP